MSRVTARFLTLAWAALLLFPTLSTAQMTRGAISGTVRDASAALVPGAVVTVTNLDTNQSRGAVSDANGFYRVPALEPGNYKVRTELTGFQTVEKREVRLVAALEVTLNVDLKVGGMGEAITVLGESGAIELNKTSAVVGTTTMARQVVELPLAANRDINNLIAVGPNVVRSGGQGTYAVAGQRSRNNNYMIDGSDNNDMSVTISTSQVVPEAVAEFQVMTNQYSVDFGRNTGAQVNVITKSGTNSFHGEAWDYYRTSSLYSMTNVQKTQGLTEQPGFTRHQAGASIGGPLIKDKTFFFALYQYDGQRPEAAPGALTLMPTAAGFAALQNVPLRAGQSAASRQAVLQRLSFLQDVYSQNPVFSGVTTQLVNGVPIELGRAGVTISQPSTYHTLLARVDHRLGDSDNLTLRYHYNKRADTNNVSNTAFGPTFAGSQDLKDTNLALSETHIFGPSVVNEFRFSWVQRDLLFPENDPESPTAAISGLFTIGGASNFPQSRVSDAFQFSNVATWTKNKHSIKVGADVRYNKMDNQAAFDSKGTFTFNNLQSYMNNDAAQLRQALQTASFQANQWQAYIFAGDDFRVTPDLTLNLGLRYEYGTIPLGMFGATDAESLAVMVPGPVEKDMNNFAPSIGFNWAPRSSSSLIGDGKTVVRGGFRMGYDVLFYNLLTVNGSNYPRVAVADVFSPGVQDVYPSLLPKSGSAVFSPTNAYTNSPVDTQNPDSKSWSLSVGREIGDFVVEVGYTGSKTGHGINQIHANPAILTEAQAALVVATRNANAIPSVQARRVDPAIGGRTLIPAYVGPGSNDVEARSEYNGVYVSLNKRLRHGIQFNASYTYSKFESNNDASLGEGGTTESSQRPQDMYDYDVEWSLSQFDRPHRFVVGYLIELPGPKSGLLRQVLGGWQLSGITQFQSGRPFTIWTGVDSNGDGNVNSDRPDLVGGSLTWDKEHKTFTNNGYVTAPVGTNNLPLANSMAGGGSLGRNTERTASWWQSDLSLLKRFFLWGDKQIVIRADAFNVFNQDDYGLPTINMSSASFGQNTNSWGQRTFTLGAKFVF
jgi:hypothetical protein